MSTSKFDARRVTSNWVSYHECEAMCHLHAAGRSASDIAFMLERDEKTVREHIKGECSHINGATPKGIRS